ncbi:hypothetical protein, partial [Thermogemmatispora sp.]|uniref:hypothetical protein n=1 Tax=Thermogemmatispora sp. TaxID=1968838 RepID=UPI002ACC2844
SLSQAIRLLDSKRTAKTRSVLTMVTSPFVPCITQDIRSKMGNMSKIACQDLEKEPRKNVQQ